MSPRGRRPLGLLVDLFLDLRDRRLLVPVCLLAVALVAVPVALRKEPATPAVAPAVVAGNAAAQVSPAVLAAEPGIRNYRKRLAALEEKNPFDQKFALPRASDVAIEVTEPEGGDDGPPTDSPSMSPPQTTPGPPASPGARPPGPGPATPPRDDDPDTEPGAEPPEPKPESEDPRLFAARVDVKVGPAGAAEVIEGARYFDFLPDDKAPVAAYVGVLEGGGAAVFAVSDDVADAGGEGRCAPRRAERCEFLTLREGEQRWFSFGPDEPRYRLKLLAVELVPVPNPRGR